MAKQKNIMKEAEERIAAGLPSLSQALIDEVHQSDDKLLSPEARVKQMQYEIEKKVESSRKLCVEGLHLCLQEIEEISPQKSDQVRKNLKKTMQQINSVEKVEQFGMQLAIGKTWNELLHFDHELLEVLYKAAKSLLDKQRYQDAQSAFTFLTMLDGKQSLFWLGLGHAAFYANNPDLAINSYAMSSMCDPASVLPHLYAADTFEAQKDFTHARRALEEAQKILQLTPQEVELIEQVNQRLAEL
jgi:tetratricopeptide (TPR) repeat protein